MSGGSTHRPARKIGCGLVPVTTVMARSPWALGDFGTVWQASSRSDAGRLLARMVDDEPISERSKEPSMTTDAPVSRPDPGPDLFRLDGRVALVTGAGGELASAAALGFARAGAS